MKARRRLRLNLGIFLGVAVSVTFWFKLHLEHYVTESLLIGGTMSLWLLFQLATSVLKWGAEEELKSLPGRLLGGVNSTKFLLFCLLVSAGLHVVTCSIHVEYDATPEARPFYKVEVLYRNNGQPYLKPLTVSSDSRIAGQPFFFRWQAVPLVVAVREPRGFAPTNLTFRFGKPVHLMVPTDFARKTFCLLRLVPSPKLLNLLAEAGGPVQTPYELELIWGGHTNVVKDFRKQTLYAGAEAEDMEYVVSKETPALRINLLRQYLARQSFDPARREPVLGVWETNRLFVATAELKAMDRVRVIVRRAPLHDESETVFETNVTMEAKHEIQTIFLEPEH